MTGLKPFPCLLQKLPSASGESIFVGMFTFLLLFFTMVVNSPSSDVYVTPP